MKRTFISVILTFVLSLSVHNSSSQELRRLTANAGPTKVEVDSRLATRQGAESLYGISNLTSTSAIVPTVPAFPGAEGYGAASVGGRGGAVYEVTNLNDSGPGSLRFGAEAYGLRTIVFRTGGTIVVQSKIKIDNPFVTIAGQTAPGDGITIATDSSYTGPAFSIEANDIIIRHLRIRPGPSGTLTNGIDAMSILSGSRIIVDHCSLSWATDEVISSAYSPSDITIQWSIISEGLHDSTHIEGPHSRGALMGRLADNLSFHHNLMAHNFRRNPEVNSYQIADVVNNVIYNWGEHAVNIKGDQRTIQINVVGNYALPGADTVRFWTIVQSDAGGAELYVKGNIGPTRLDDSLPEEDAVHPEDRIFLVSDRQPAPPVTTTSAFDAYDQVLTLAGATVPARDPVDRRVVDSVISRTGRIIDDPSQVGGWPVMAAGTPPADSDHDGMPDWWEEANGLDPNNISDGPLDPDLDGYTNLEHYLNSLVQRAPQVYAGPDQTVTLPVAAVLDGTAFDDGLPNPPGALTISWTKMSGPGLVSFGDATALQTTADFSQPGDYILRLSVSDGESTTTDDLTIAAVTNQAPNVSAGPDLTVVLPGAANLNGTVTDDGAPNPPGAVTTSWSKVAGPGEVVFGDASAFDTSATFSAAGSYALRLTADDGETNTFDDVSVNVMQSSGLTTVEVQVAATRDDAEEDSFGSVGYTSNDLEMVRESSDQIVGMRFSGLNVPQRAGIAAAYIQFQVDESGSEDTSLVIQGQSVDDAPTFNSSTNDISSRARTVAAVPWTVAPWPTVGQAGTDQRTPDISAVIQELVSRPDWSADHSLAILITGTGKRTAESFDGDSSAAPLLHVEFATMQPPEPEVDLSIDISDSPDPVTAGDEFTYNLTVHNSGPGEATGVVVTDSLPAEVNLVSTSGCPESPGVPLCTLGTIAMGASKSYSILVTAMSSGSMSNQAIVSENETDSDPTNNAATEQTEVAAANQPPDVTITGPSSGEIFTEGDEITFGANATDPEEGNISTALVWVSNLDGQIGIGGGFSSSTLSPGSHLITASVIDSGGLSGSDNTSITVNSFTGITLLVDGFKSRGLQKATLNWDGAQTALVEIYRDGSLQATTPNDGFFTDDIDGRGRGTYQFRVCETGGGACSTTATVEF